MRNRTFARRLGAAVVGLAATAGLALVAPASAQAPTNTGTASSGPVVQDDLGGATAGIVYVGDWSVVAGTGYHGGSLHRSTSRDSLLSVTFTGASATLYGTRGPDHGIVEFAVDGGAWTRVDLYAATPAVGAPLYRTPTLAAGPHTVMMRLTGGRGSVATGTAAALDRVEVSTAASTGNSFVTRAGGTLQLDGARFRFAGANLYWLGLDDNITDSGGPTYPTKFRIDNALQAAKNAGLTVIRSHTMGISVGCARCVEPRLGEFNDDAFQASDYALHRAGQLGLKVMIPLTDQWRWFHGGMSTFTGWRGYANQGGATAATDNSVNAANNQAQRAAESHFYTDATVSGDFQQYVTHLLEHVNPYTGLAWKDDPTIMAWETGNELWTATPSWTQNLAAFIKHRVGARQLVADGSAASGMSVAAAAVDAPDVDILGGHFYPVDTAWMTRDAAVAATHNKAYVVGEYAWTDVAATKAQLAAVESDPRIAGDLVWTLMPYREDGSPEAHDDGYALYYPATTPSMKTVMQLIVDHAAVMSRR